MAARITSSQRLAFALLVLTAFVSATAVRPAQDTVHDADDLQEAHLHWTAEGHGYFLATGDTSSSEFGPLTSSGKNQVDTRMTRLVEHARTDFEYLAKASTKVWIAPTKAAMATALVALARSSTLRHERGSIGFVSDTTSDTVELPKISFHPGLVHATDVTLEDIGDVAMYLDGISTQYTLKYALLEAFASRAAEDVTKVLKEEYAKYVSKVSTTLEPAVDEHAVTLESALQIYGKVHRIRRSMHDNLRRGDIIVMIGSPMIGSYLHMAFLPRVVSPKEEVQLDNLANMRREGVAPLAPAAVLRTQWATSNSMVNPHSFFRQVSSIDGRSDELPGWAAPKTFPYDIQGSIGEEEQIKELLPEKCLWWVGAMQKSKKKFYGYTKPKTRLIYIAYQPARPYAQGAAPWRGYVIWMTPFGEKQKGLQQLMDITAELVTPEDDRAKSYVEMSAGKSRWRLSGGADVNKDFVKQVRTAQNQVYTN